MSVQLPIRVAVLGAAGRQGRRRVDAIGRVPGLALGGLADIPAKVSQLRELSSRYDCKYDTDWEAWLRDDSIDAIVICTPNNEHVVMALGALGRGKHVLVEKPLAVSMEDTAKVIWAAEVAGLVLKVGFNCPYSEPVQHGFKQLFDGSIGTLLGMRAVISHSHFLAPSNRKSWFCQTNLPGNGAWLDLGIHLVDLANRAITWCGDEFQTVTAQISSGKLLVDDMRRGMIEEECVATYRTRGDRLVTLHASWIDIRPFAGGRVELIGDGGRVEIDMGQRTCRLFQLHSDAVASSIVEFKYVEPDPCWAVELAIFRDKIIGIDGVVMGEDSPLAVHRLAFAAYESVESGGRPIVLNNEFKTARASWPGRDFHADAR